MANDDYDMRRLMEQLLPYFDPCRLSASVAPADSYTPSGHMTKHFFEKMRIVLSSKQYLIHGRWEKFWAISYLKALSSHEMYLRYLMFACYVEIGLSEKVFDQLLSVCALVMTFNAETFNTTGVNFYELSVDVFMAFYKLALEEPFYRHGGFKRLTEYLSEECLILSCYYNDDSKISHIPAELRESYRKYAREQIDKVFGKDSFKPEYHTHDDIIKRTGCDTLAKEVLLTTKIKLPSLPSSDELKVRIRSYRQSRAKKSEKSEKAPTDNSTSGVKPDDSKRETTTDVWKRETMTDDSKRETTGIVLHRSSNYHAIYSAEDEANIAWCDDIVRRVTMYNNSNRSDPHDANNQIQNDLEKILEHLKNTIKRLIDVL